MVHREHRRDDRREHFSRADIARRLLATMCCSRSGALAEAPIAEDIPGNSDYSPGHRSCEFIGTAMKPA